MVKFRPKQKGSQRTGSDSKGLPAGWIRVESRSKPGAYFYAHPATKRTQTEHPAETQQRKVASKRPAVAEGPRRPKGDEGVSPMDVEDFEDPAAKAERLRQEAEEAEAAEASRQEMVRQQRAAKRALLKEAEEKKDDEGSDEEKELVSKEELEKWKEDEERREREEAEAERQRKEEEERRRKEEERRRLEEERRREEEERRIEEEKIALWKARTEMARKEFQFEMAMSRERAKKEESDKVLLEAERLRQALLEKKKQESEEENRKAEAELRARKAEADRLRREAEATNAKNQRIPEPADHIEVPCFDVFKNGSRIGRFPLAASPVQTTWTIGRCPPLEIRASHETVSRKHAQVTRQGCFTFIQDLGSAHGTFVNGQKLVKNTLERICSGDNLRFGCSSRVYVYREPSTAIQINQGLRNKPITIEQDIPEPPLESPKLAAGRPMQTGPAAAPGSPITVYLPPGPPERPVAPAVAAAAPAVAVAPPVAPALPRPTEEKPSTPKSKEAKKAKKSSSSSSSKKKRKKKASSSSSSSKSKGKKRKSSKRKKSSSSSSSEKSKKRKKSRSKRKSSSS